MVKGKASEKFVGVKEAFEEARKVAGESSIPGVPAGMIVDDLAEVEDDTAEDETPAVHKPKPRKTKQQKKKAEKLRAEVRLFPLVCKLDLNALFLHSIETCSC